MSDIATLWDIDQAVGDWQISAAAQPLWIDEIGNSVRDHYGRPVGAPFVAGDGLVTSLDLQTALLISLFTDAAAGPDDLIPDGSADPRGWWGDPNIGSKLWLLSRSKATPDIPARAKAYIEQALQWLLDDQVVASITVTTEWTQPSLLGATVVLKRQDGNRAALRFSRLWETV